MVATLRPGVKRRGMEYLACRRTFGNLGPDACREIQIDSMSVRGFFAKMFDGGPRAHPVLRNDPVFIIGMHRSGTSALGGVLDALGLNTGKTVMPANPERGNPKGFFENQAMVDLHDQFLTAIRWGWLKPFPIPRRRFRAAVMKRYREEILRVMTEEFGSTRPLIKDPRICELLPLWRPLVETWFAAASFIVPIRPPLEVAASLRKRDNFTLTHGLTLWAVHVLEAEKGSRGFKRHFTVYEDLLAKPVETVTALARALALPVEKVEQAVARQVDPALRHHAQMPWPAGEPHRDLIMGIYQALLRQEPDMEGTLDKLQRQYYRVMRFRT